MRQIMIILFAAFADMAMAASVSPWEKDFTNGMTPTHGAYHSDDFGFMVQPVSKGHMYIDSTTTPSRGVVFVLGDQRTLSVSGEYDEDQDGTTEAYMDQELADEEPGAVVSRTKITLGGKPAEMVILHKEEQIEKLIVQRRSDASGGVLYELDVTTTAADQSKDFAAFDKLIASFKTRKVIKAAPVETSDSN